MCPHGNSPETIRLADALESGAIPVVEEAEYLHHFPEPPPFVVVKNWKEAAEKMKAVLSLDKAGELQRANIHWWKRYKTCLNKDLQHLVDLAFDAKLPMRE